MRPTGITAGFLQLTWLMAWAVTGHAAQADGLPLSQQVFLPKAPQAYVLATRSGGPGKDGIPSIDQPQFLSAADGDRLLADDDRIIGVYLNGEARAYPQRILVWHEIVNDTVAGIPVSVTYCPLTGTGLGFLRGDSELGVSGKLVNSNLIMYDRSRGTEWSQILGAGIQGPHTGSGLQETRVFWTTWKRWQERHPDTTVLATRTGHARNYRRDPYGSYTSGVDGYYREQAPRLFPVMHESERFPPKREIFGFRTAEGHAVAVDRDYLAEQAVIEHVRDGVRYLILHDPGLDTGWVFRDRQKHGQGSNQGSKQGSAAIPQSPRFTAAGPQAAELSEWEAVNGFEAMWFAWHAFYPDTEVLSADEG